MHNKNTQKGCFVISLDFEMMWGCHEWSTIGEYGMSNVANVREVITKMLELFKKYNVHATFATVGMIMAKDKSDLTRFIPKLKPNYLDENKSPYKPGFIEEIKKEEEFLFFAPDIIDLLKETDGIEIGTHTFSHYYCWSPGQSIEEFEEDIKAAVNIATAKGIKLKSVVFPKNEVDEKYLQILRRYGITNYRGNATYFFNNPKSKAEAYRFMIGRIADAYFPIVNNLFDYAEITTGNGVNNVKASRLFRSYSNILRLMEPLRIRRIKKEIKTAARNGKVYHLWWHPHNFGSNIEKNIRNLESVLKAYSLYANKYGIQSMNMSELADMKD
ncbi:MAG: polysaccharide deacetylase family protein [Bacteroides sp.]|nr:polysaccharide deacetylase family protein [Bacteroides sp.]